MDIHQATKSYEQWLSGHTHLLAADVRLKHTYMAQDPLMFLRATFYRWAQLYPSVCPAYAKALFDATYATACAELADLIRDLIGNPFHAASLNPVWQTPTVVSLAQSIYEGRTFERMPELADALETAGCTNADILAHCREPGDHVRGCWGLDLVLGKA